MKPDANFIDRRTCLVTTGAETAGTISLTGCIGSAIRTLATQVTDHSRDIGSFEECVVTIIGMWLGPEGAEADNEEGEEPSGREYHEEPQQADLVELQGDATRLVNERKLDTGTYEFLQLDIDSINATLEDGSDATVEVPGEAPLTFNERFDIREGTRTLFTADFTSVQRGQAGGYILQPVPDGITVKYEEDG